MTGPEFVSTIDSHFMSPGLEVDLLAMSNQLDPKAFRFYIEASRKMREDKRCSAPKK